MIQKQLYTIWELVNHTSKGLKTVPFWNQVSLIKDILAAGHGGTCFLSQHLEDGCHSSRPAWSAASFSTARDTQKKLILKNKTKQDILTSKRDVT